MQILLLAIGLPLVLSLPWTASLFDAAAALEATHIATDNAGIRLGKRDRALLSELDGRMKSVRALDKLHHPLHTCASLPEPTQECVVADRVMERKIRSLYRWAMLRAQQRWTANLTGLQTGTGAFDVRLCRLLRSPVFPVKTVSCPVCGLPVRLKFDLDALKTRIVFCHSKRGMKATVETVPVKRREGWNYLLRE